MINSNSYTLKSLLIFIIIVLDFNQLKAQLHVDTSYTVQYLVQNVLLGNGVNVSNIQFNGGSQSIAKFNGINSNIGLSSGLILSTGSVLDAVGPNNSSSGNAVNGNLGLPGDTNLTILASLPPGYTTHDAAVLQFDFVPMSDSLKFSYVFASEEYPEYVCSSYNDVFAFFLTGPKPGGGNYSNANLAIIPGTNMAVTINNVNNGSSQAGACTNINAAYYVDNGDGSNPNANPTVQFDGFTVPLEAKAAVVPGQTYHIKIAIADAGDNVFESAVFLLEKSFSSLPQSIYAWSSVADSVLYESCSHGKFIFKRLGSQTNDLTVKFKIQGNAQNGIDYLSDNNQPLPDSVVILHGQNEAVLNIYPLFDLLDEADEKITITAFYVIGTDTVILKSSLIIRNVNKLKVATAEEVNICPDNLQPVLLSAAISGGLPPYSLLWTPGNYNQNNQPVLPLQTTVFQLNVTDTCLKSNVAAFQKINVVCDLEIPNIITPNNDNSNDFFVIKNIEFYPKSKLIIYNRWGKEIYTANAYKNNWNAENYSDGVYFYLLDLGENNRTYKGSLTVLR